MSSIVKFEDQSSFMKTWGKAKASLRKDEEALDKMLMDGTVEARAAVDAAMAKLDEEIKTIQSSEAFHTLEKDAEVHRKSIDLHLQSAITYFNRQKKKIMEDSGKDAAQKEKEIFAIYNAILGRLYTEEEIKAFRRLAGGRRIIMIA